MSGLSRRFWLAASLVLLAVAAPCAAWYVAGQRSVEREIRQMEEQALHRGHQIAYGLAERLRGRLDAMADVESLRPFYHFHPTFHDPTASCECRSDSPSPLATGPGDPFIATYFQIDSYGRVSFPSTYPRSEYAYRVEQGLRIAAQACLDAVDAVSQPRAVAASRSLLPLAELAPADSSGVFLMDLLAADPWLEVEAFQWHTIELNAVPCLVAMRRVQSTRAPLVQGFVLSQEAVQDWLRAAELPASLQPAALDPPGEIALASIALECTQWDVTVAIDESLREAESRAGEIRADFHRSFGVGSGAAFVAALAVIGVLGLTERNARQRARFAASAAHELRTPLAGLRLYGDMLASDELSDEKRRRYAQRIAGESERLGRVVTNVLGFTQLERGQMQARAQSGDLGAHVQEIVERLRAPLEASGASLEFALPAAPVTARFDPEAVETILRNLVDNAEKYGRGSADRRIHVEVDSDGDDAWLRVRDHGPGVDPSLGDRLFEPFVRGADESLPAGLGLGMMLAHSLAKAQDARLEWRNEADEGACFTLSLPGVSGGPA